MDGKDELDTLFGTDFISKVVKLVQNTQHNTNFKLNNDQGLGWWET